jgi:hypothetical protein
LVLICVGTHIGVPLRKFMFACVIVVQIIMRFMSTQE